MGSLTFVGTATAIIRLGGFNILTDPNFLHRGQRAYLGKGLWSRRRTEPSTQPEELPRLDAVVLSHLHGDHFDRVARRRLSREQPVFTTPAAARRLSSWGFAAEGLATWETALLQRDDESLSIRSLPGIHGRGAMSMLLPPVMGSLLEYRKQGQTRHRLYVSGDTLTGEHISEIARRHPDIDTAMVHLGGTRVLLHTVTMDAEQGVDFLHRCSPGRAIAVHYDDYRVFRSPVAAFTERAAAEAQWCTVQVPRRGETVELPDRLSDSAPR